MLNLLHFEIARMISVLMVVNSTDMVFSLNEDNSPSMGCWNPGAANERVQGAAALSRLVPPLV